MFTNSGMMPFVPYFIGEEPVPYRRRGPAPSRRACGPAASTTTSTRIGRSPRHLSFFEMLGNFSFGDYFKADAIRWAWSSRPRSSASTPSGSGSPATSTTTRPPSCGWTRSGSPPSASSASARTTSGDGRHGAVRPVVRALLGLRCRARPRRRPSEPGRGEPLRRVLEPGLPAVLPPRRRQPQGLETRNIDTGAGLERILGVTIGSPDVFQTDELRSLVAAAEQSHRRSPGTAPESDVALKLLADHARTMTFLVTDGVVLSNEDRGYVLRRIIRRAIRFAYLLGVEKPITPGCPSTSWN
ncbi:MAG: alanine--tRNA ligase-related protein [Acidimicrobiales bacterium]